jgi:hypothetical protein
MNSYGQLYPLLGSHNTGPGQEGGRAGTHECEARRSLIAAPPASSHVHMTRGGRRASSGSGREARGEGRLVLTPRPRNQEREERRPEPQMMRGAVGLFGIPGGAPPTWPPSTPPPTPTPPAPAEPWVSGSIMRVKWEAGEVSRVRWVGGGAGRVFDVMGSRCAGIGRVRVVGGVAFWVLDSGGMRYRWVSVGTVQLYVRSPAWNRHTEPMLGASRH